MTKAEKRNIVICLSDYLAWLDHQMSRTGRSGWEVSRRFEGLWRETKEALDFFKTYEEDA